VSAELREAVDELAAIVARIAYRCWENLGTAEAHEIVRRTGAIRESLAVSSTEDQDQ
jgi:hypothetical protein